ATHDPPRPQPHDRDGARSPHGPGEGPKRLRRRPGRLLAHLECRISHREPGADEEDRRRKHPSGVPLARHRVVAGPVRLQALRR
ncbi:MAG: hypothetical protein AVDCRST_MAG30-1841, partial [uncultured Solirubrobacteraceae bacterium]